MITTETPPKVTHNEVIKDAIPTLAGNIAATVASGTDQFSTDDQQFIKFHGIYQQDDRDLRKTQKKFMNCWSSAENWSVPEATVAAMLPANVGMASLMISLCVNFGALTGGSLIISYSVKIQILTDMGLDCQIHALLSRTFSEN